MKDGTNVNFVIDLRQGQGKIYIGETLERADYAMKMKEDTFINLFVHKKSPVRAFILG